jgi:NAD+ diphosphatase
VKAVITVSNPRFERIYPPNPAPQGAPLWAIFRAGDLVTFADAPGLLADVAEFGEPGNPLLLGSLGEQPVYTFEIADDSVVPSIFAPISLRDLLAHGPAQLAQIADYASQILRWMRNSRFCPACGQAIELADGWGKRCAACRHLMYPPASPAIIVLIHDERRALLTTKQGWGNRYSLVAGFVEPGETFEECVAREVREEVGVEVDQVQYLHSQSWPFPHQVMVGFLAHYAGGEIVIDTTELSDARWFSVDALPDLPPPYAISRQIIEIWRGRVGAQQ